MSLGAIAMSARLWSMRARRWWYFEQKQLPLAWTLARAYSTRMVVG